MELKFGLATPSNLWSLAWQDRQQALSTIVDSGFDHIFMADHVSFRDGSGTDGFVEVASLSQLNPDIGVMISIYLLPLRHPLPVARQLASMARIAPGRMIFGVGIGGEDRHESGRHRQHQHQREEDHPDRDDALAATIGGCCDLAVMRLGPLGSHAALVQLGLGNHAPTLSVLVPQPGAR